MISSNIINKIHSIWDEYVNANKTVYDTRGNEIPSIDDKRKLAIIDLQEFIKQFLTNEITIYEFRTKIDSFNKRNNLWGFTAMKGQMFFNQLVKTQEEHIDDFVNILKEIIECPSTLSSAIKKIEKLESHCKKYASNAPDKRKVPNSSSSGYFLSYFWHVCAPETWPIMYTSQVNSYRDLGIWKEQSSQTEMYRYFYTINEEVKKILSKYAGKTLTNLDVEHPFWNYNGNPNKVISRKSNTIENDINKPHIDLDLAITNDESVTFSLYDDIREYVIPRIASLVELGKDKSKSNTSKGCDFEKLVSEAFSLLGFQVESLGQGTGRNPDAIIKSPEDLTAFLIDAKAYSSDYTLGADDRAIREYALKNCPKLQKQGFRKIGFIIVSNSFKSNFETFGNDITWETDIKRFILLSTEALICLLAYKIKYNLDISSTIETLISLNNPIQAQDITARFKDI